MNSPDPSKSPLRMVWLRFQQITRLSKRAATTVSVVLILAIALFSVRIFTYHRSPEYAFHVVDKVNTVDDIGRYREYFTPQGQKLYTYLLSRQNGPSPSTGVTFQTFQIRGGTCYFPFTFDNNAGYIQFRQNGVWQFDDIVLTRDQGRDIQESLAYAMDHPILAGLQMLDWNEMLNSFIKGFFIGFKLAGGG